MAGPAPIGALRRRARRLAADDRGVGFVELLVAMVVLATVLVPLTAAFGSATRASIEQADRFASEENARMALEKLRKDAHCAHAVGGLAANEMGGWTLLLTETNTSGEDDCPGLIQQNAASVQWCTAAVAGSTERFQLYRESDADQSCTGATATFLADFLTGPDVFSLPACSAGEAPAVGVALVVDRHGAASTAGSYTLQDQIALRNADRCT